jgi:signal transduction histidine kinase
LHLLRESVKDEEDRAAISQLEEVVTDAIRDTRSLLFHLVPPDLERDGLAAAVHGLLAQLEQDTGVRTDLDTIIVVEPSISVAITAYRIVQEAIANVRKHAACTTVGVTLRTDAGAVWVTVTDDGAGFDSSRGVEGGHLGLKAMHERVRVAGGHLEIRSSPGEGTTIDFELPTGR